MVTVSLDRASELSQLWSCSKIYLKRFGSKYLSLFFFLIKSFNHSFYGFSLLQQDNIIIEYSIKEELRVISKLSRVNNVVVFKRILYIAAFHVPNLVCS